MSSALGRRRPSPGATLFAGAGPVGPAGPAGPDTVEVPGLGAAVHGTHPCEPAGPVGPAADHPLLAGTRGTRRDQVSGPASGERKGTENKGAEAAGTHGTRGTHPCADADEERRTAAFLARAAAEVAEALVTPDPDLDDERAGVVAARAAEAHGLYGAPLPEPEHGGAVAALLAVAAQRPPAWPDQSSRPTAGCRCTCCGRGRWWAPEHPVLDCTGLAPGWRCATCYPPPYFAPGELLEVLT
jgi:hypothetical protein